MKTNSLYVHIPFCDTICHYCDFCKVYYDKKLVDRYLERLYHEIQKLSLGNLNTIYIGGGTPSSLDDNQLENLMDMLKPYANQVKEYTVEVNPESIDLFKLRLLKQGGVNRLSIGVQTFQDDILKQIDRHHSYQQVLRAIQHAKQVGFDNISIDLMYGLPTQTIDDIKKDLEIVRELDLQHISYYSLILEDHTILKFKNYQPLSDEEEYQYNCLIDQELDHMGFHKYEISNYAKEGYESKHNLVYWHYDNYIGVGIGACSKIDDQMIDNSQSLTYFLEGQNRQSIQTLSKEDVMFNHLMMSLRLVEGLSFEMFQQRYHVDLYETYKYAIDKNIKENRLEIKEGYLKTTSKGMYVLNDILLDFMD